MDILAKLADLHKQATTERSHYYVAGLAKQAKDEIARLQKQNDKLRSALAPFACLGRNELRPGDFNRARRAVSDGDTAA